MTPAHYHLACGAELDSRPDRLVLMRSEHEIFTFDREGRLLTCYDGESHFWRGLSGEAVRKYTAAGGIKRIEPLGAAEADRLVRRAQERALLDEWRELEPEARERIRNYDPVDDRRAFADVYQPVAILPPDQYLALVLQAAIGCSWNRCTFCDFYRGQRYRVRTLPEFTDHVERVTAFLGRSALLRRRFFLGDADMLAMPHGRLLECLRLTSAAFPGRPASCFGEAASAARKTAEQLAQLRQAGLERVYIGAESGHDPLLEHWSKRSRVADLGRGVANLRAAGIRIGLIFLAGVEAEWRESHLAGTAALVRSLPLADGDLLYVSPLFQAGDAAMGQVDDLRRRLAEVRQAGVKVALYDIRQMVY